MDQRQFDRLARLLGGATDRRAGLKAAFGALLGAGGAAAALELDAEAKKQGKDNDRKGAAGPNAEKRKKRKKTCKPACTAGFECVKQGKKRVCACLSGVECGAACCLAGQTCESGTCVADPQPTTCLAFGEACKNVGKRCCDGLACGSGQDGSFPIACYQAAGSSCASAADCGFGHDCDGGICTPTEQPDGGGGGGGGGSVVPAGSPCSASTTCSPGTTCQAYDTPVTSAPDGTFCSKDLIRTCTGDPECSCYKCWYVRPGVTPTSVGGRQERASSNVKACCQPPGGTCSVSDDCCLGLYCNNGSCSGTLELPLGATCDATTGPQCYDSECTNGTCQLELGDECDPATTGVYCPTGSTCRQYNDTSTDPFTYCLLPVGATCESSSDCVTDKCATVDGSEICTECVTDAACEAIKGAPSTCKRWSCSAGLCSQVAATNTLCSLSGGTGYCQADATCGAATATCDVQNGDASALLQALQNAPYKSAISISGTFRPTAEFSLAKFGCKDNEYSDNNTNCSGYNPTDRVPWDVTLVACSGQSATIDGGSTANTSDSNPANWTWTGGHRIFKLTDYSMTIKGVTLQNGNASDGGAIQARQDDSYPVGGTLTLQDVTISSNKSSRNGGGLDTDLKALTLNNVTFTKNWTAYNGGAVFANDQTGQSVTLNGVTMTGNVANSGSTSGRCDQGAFCLGAGIYAQAYVTNFGSKVGTLTCSGTNTINNDPSYATAVADCVTGSDLSSASVFAWTSCGCATTAIDT